jgi:tetratricopeptide (TPR) repeat protein
MSIAGALIVVVVAATFPQSEARDSINNGVRAFRNADYKAAVEYCKQALDLDPNMTTAELYLATAYAQQYIPGGRGEDNENNAQMAIQTFEKVLRRDPNNVNAVAGLASIYFNLGQNDTKQLQKSKELYTNYAQLDSTNPVPYTIGVLNWLIVYDKKNTFSTDEKLKIIDEGLENIEKALVEIMLGLAHIIMKGVQHVSDR